MRLLGIGVLWFALALVPAYGQGDDGLPLDLGSTTQVRATIRGTDVNFRTGPGTQYPRVGQFGGGNAVRVVGRQGNWVQVAMASSQGEERVWVHGNYVQETRDTLPLPGAGRIDLPALVREHLAVVRDPARFHVGNAAQLMNENFQALDSLDPAAVDYAAIDRDPDQLIRDLFAVTLALDDRMAAFDAEGQFDVAMVEAKRRAMRGLRFLREQVMMRMAAGAPERKYEHGEPRLAHQLPGFQWVVNPDHDVPIGRSTFPRTFFLMNVGNSTVSAAIARSSSVDTMFSHFSIGYFLPEAAEVEGKTLPAGTLVTMEAHIEAGVLIMPWADHFKSSAREVIFFVRDRSKQADVDRAAGIMFERVRRALNKGKAIGYDFSMGHKGLKDVIEGGEGGQPQKKGLIHATNYFCSGVADAIGDEAGVNLFTHRSKLEQGSNSEALFRSWGMNPSLRVPAPGDGDVSTSLVRVAEGTHVAKMTDSHLMHAVLKSMFEWMDADGYTLRQPWWFKAGSFVAGNLNSDSFNIGMVPRGIDTSIMRSFAALHKSATAYSERLAAENEAFRARQGRNMTPREAMRFLRSVRDDVKGAKPWFGRS